MKKIILTLTALFFVQIQSFAVENNNILNLHTGNSYIIPTQQRAINLQNSNPRIVTVEADTDIDSSDSSLLITTYEEGIAYISFKQKNETITIKILIDNKADEDTNILKLDKPDEMDKK